MICLSCGSECQTAHHWDGAKSHKEWICGDCKVKELADRLAQVVKERDVLKDRESQMGRQLAMASIELEDAHKERDELKSVKTCDGCEYDMPKFPGRCIIYCKRNSQVDWFKPRDPSAAQGGVG